MPSNNNNNNNDNNITTNESRVNTVFDELMNNATIATLKFIKNSTIATLKFIKNSFLSLIYLCTAGLLLLILFFPMMFAQGLEEAIRDIFSNRLSTNRSGYYTVRFSDFIDRINIKILKMLTIYHLFKDNSPAQTPIINPTLKGLINTKISKEQFIRISSVFKFEPNEKNISNCKSFLEQILSCDRIKNYFFTTVNSQGKKIINFKEIGDNISKFMSYLDTEYTLITGNNNKDLSNLDAVIRFKFFFNNFIKNPIEEQDLKTFNEDDIVERYTNIIDKYLNNLKIYNENNVNKTNAEETESISNDEVNDLKQSIKFHNQSKDNMPTLRRSISLKPYFNVKEQNNNLIRSKSRK